MLRPPDLTGPLDPSHAVPLPAAHGVLLLVRGDRPVLALATANLRDAAESKRAADDAPFDAIHAWRTGSSFEADLLSVDVLRARLPEMLGEVSARLGVWWLRADPERPWEGWSVADGAESGGEIVGPFVDRASARRWSEMLDGEFELCREPGELRRAPEGTPCPYKDMGLCRATCEGGEAMEAYDARLAEAVRLTVGGAERRRADLEGSMRAASAEGAFERASVLRDRLESLPSGDDRASAAVGPLSRFAFVAVAGSARAHHARVLTLNAAAWGVAGEFDARAAGEDDLAGAIESATPAATIDPPIAGLIARELIRPRRGGPAILTAAGLEPRPLLAEVRRAAGIRPHPAGADDDA